MHRARIEENVDSTYSLHCSSFFGGLPFRILTIKLVKPKKGTTMETIGRSVESWRRGSMGVVVFEFFAGAFGFRGLGFRGWGFRV